MCACVCGVKASQGEFEKANVPFPAVAGAALAVAAADAAAGDGAGLGAVALLAHGVWIVVLARRVGVAPCALGRTVRARVLPTAELDARLGPDALDVTTGARDVRVVAGCVPYG